MVKEAKGNESNQGTSLAVLNLGFLTFFFETQMNGWGGGGGWGGLVGIHHLWSVIILVQYANVISEKRPEDNATGGNVDIHFHI